MIAHLLTVTLALIAASIILATASGAAFTLGELAFIIGILLLVPTTVIAYVQHYRTKP